MILPERVVEGMKMNMVNDDVAFATPIPGLHYDFNFGPRVKLPDASYSVSFVDLETGQGMEQENYFNALKIEGNGFFRYQRQKKYYGDVICGKLKYCRPVEIQVYKNDGGLPKLVFSHKLDLRGKKVHIEMMMTMALGDLLSMVPQIEAFRKKHGCEVYVTVRKKHKELLQKNFPQWHIIPLEMRPEEFQKAVEKQYLPKDIYATYFWRPRYGEDEPFGPEDIRQVGMLKVGANILNLNPPADKFPTPLKAGVRKIKEPYVCISMRASNMVKEWNNPLGWPTVVKYLKEKGYRVLCIDGDSPEKLPYYKAVMEAGCEDYSGFKPLQSRVDMLSNAEFFMGLGSGLSWLAWACGRKVVLISGFSLPVSEFPTPYRVINENVCHGCWNDMLFDDQIMYNKCPYFWNTERELECSRAITPEMVLAKLQELGDRR